LNESAGLDTLFLSSFPAATVLPGVSEDAHAAVAALR